MFKTRTEGREACCRWSASTASGKNIFVELGSVCHPCAIDPREKLSCVSVALINRMRLKEVETFRDTYGAWGPLSALMFCPR